MIKSYQAPPPSDQIKLFVVDQESDCFIEILKVEETNSESQIVIKAAKYGN